MEKIFIKQRSQNDCGIAVTCMAINYLQKKSFTLEQIKYDNNIGNSDLSFFNIKSITEKYSLDFETYNAELEEILEMGSKDLMVLNVKNAKNQNHFILVMKVRNEKFLIGDPSENDFRWVHISELKKMYNGYFGIFKKKSQIKFETKKLFNWFYFLKDSKFKIAGVIFLSLFFNFSLLLSNNFLRFYLTNVDKEEHNISNKIFIGFCIIFIIQIFLDLLINKIIDLVKNNVSLSIFNEYKKRLLELSLENYQNIESEKWMDKINDCNIISSFLSTTTLDIPIKFILFLFSSIIIVLVSPFIFILILFENFLYIVTVYFISFFIKDKEYQNKIKQNEFNVKLYEMINGFSEIKAKQLDNYISSNLNQSLINYKKSDSDTNFLRDVNRTIVKVIFRIFYLLIFYFSISMIQKNEFSIGYLIFYASISTHIQSFSNTSINLFLQRQKIKLSNENLWLLFKKKEEESFTKTVDKINKIELKNIYKYNNEIKLCNNISKVIDDSTFIMGKSGSGKTTILKIISGLYNEYDGGFFINDINIKNLDLNFVRNKIFYLGQQDFLFKGTVWSNIQLFQNNISIEKFQKLGLLEVMEMNNIDISRNIFDNGSNLSKGQKQIINFIPTLFIEKDVFIIDESLSNVDQQTKVKLLDIFFECHKDKIIIMCDHQLNHKIYFKNSMEVLNEK